MGWRELVGSHIVLEVSPLSKPCIIGAYPIAKWDWEVD